MKNHGAGEESDQVGDRTSDALSGENVLPKRASVGECGKIANTKAPEDSEQHCNRVRNTNRPGTSADEQANKRECQPCCQAESDKPAQQISVAHEDEISDAADEA